MKAIFKREIISYFKNPSGYFLIGVYALVSGIFFVINVVSSMQTYLGSYFGMWIYFVNVILVSLLSFKFFSEEKKNKTDQLLFTSPRSILSIVMGKFFSAALIYFIASLVNILYLWIISMFGTIFLGDFIMQMIGSLLIGLAMIAIAMFISTLTENQIATVAVTFATLILMFIIDSFTKYLPTLVSTVLEGVNLYSRFSDFSIGLLSISPVVYYISVICVFLFLTIRIIEKRRWA